MPTEKNTGTYNLKEAKAEIERLIEEMVVGESLMISKAAASVVSITEQEWDGAVLYPPVQGKRVGSQFAPGSEWN